MLETAIVLTWLGSAIFGVQLARKRKGHAWFSWIMAGLFFGPVSCLYLLGVKADESD